MDIWETDRLVLLIAFLIPGFVSIKACQLLNPEAQRTIPELLIDVLAYSSINYAILIILIYMIESTGLREASGFWYFLFYVFVFFIAPVIWALVWEQLKTLDTFRKRIPAPKVRPWDRVFGKRRSYWVKVVLKDGRIIAGYYADNSFVSSAPEPEQIYLEKTWIINEGGGFIREKNDTAGVLILSKEISYIEFRK